ncbi:exo-alpha-sialidase, partial [Trypanosoma cruzi]
PTHSAGHGPTPLWHRCHHTHSKRGHARTTPLKHTNTAVLSVRGWEDSALHTTNAHTATASRTFSRATGCGHIPAANTQRTRGEHPPRQPHVEVDPHPSTSHAAPKFTQPSLFQWNGSASRGGTK